MAETLAAVNGISVQVHTGQLANAEVLAVLTAMHQHLSRGRPALVSLRLRPRNWKLSARINGAEPELRRTGFRQRGGVQ